MIRGLALRSKPYDLLIQREAVYNLMPQVNKEKLCKNYEQYSLDPSTR